MLIWDCRFELGFQYFEYAGVGNQMIDCDRENPRASRGTSPNYGESFLTEVTDSFVRVGKIAL